KTWQAVPGAGQMPVMPSRPAVRRTLMTCACLAWVGAVCAAQTGQTEPSPARALVTKYCVTCHNERSKTANLLLDKADGDRVANASDTWEKVVVQLRSRSMPPVN